MPPAPRLHACFACRIYLPKIARQPLTSVLGIADRRARKSASPARSRPIISGTESDSPSESPTYRPLPGHSPRSQRRARREGSRASGLHSDARSREIVHGDLNEFLSQEARILGSGMAISPGPASSPPSLPSPGPARFHQPSPEEASQTLARRAVAAAIEALQGCDYGSLSPEGWREIEHRVTERMLREEGRMQLQPALEEAKGGIHLSLSNSQLSSFPSMESFSNVEGAGTAKAKSKRPTGRRNSMDGTSPSSRHRVGRSDARKLRRERSEHIRASPRDRDRRPRNNASHGISLETPGALQAVFAANAIPLNAADVISGFENYSPSASRPNSSPSSVASPRGHYQPTSPGHSLSPTPIQDPMEKAPPSFQLGPSSAAASGEPSQQKHLVAPVPRRESYSPPRQPDAVASRWEHLPVWEDEDCAWLGDVERHNRWYCCCRWSIVEEVPAQEPFDLEAGGSLQSDYRFREPKASIFNKLWCCFSRQGCRGNRWRWICRPCGRKREEVSQQEVEWVRQQDARGGLESAPLAKEPHNGGRSATYGTVATSSFSEPRHAKKRVRRVPRPSNRPILCGVPCICLQRTPLCGGPGRYVLP